MESGVRVQSALVTEADVLEGYQHDVSPVAGAAEGLLRPVDAADAAAWLVEASGRGMPVTPCGLRSGTTGAAVAPSGWVMSCEQLDGVHDIDPARRLAVVGAGAVLGQVKSVLAEQGWLYPPDPTSEHECSVGGSVACDASGARTYRYGATHRWLNGVQVALTDGTVRWFRRRPVEKDASGYAALRDLVDVFCGSEGTLGFITRVELKLVPLPEAFTAGFAFFPDVASALDFVATARRRHRAGAIEPRCLELLDGLCLDIMRAQGSGVALPAGAGAVVFFEQEHGAGDDGAVLEAWWSLLEPATPFAADTVIASDRAQQEQLRALRHAVPATLNEEGRSHAAAGGKKISTDWAVPFDELPAFMDRCDRWLREAELTRVARYGHVGNGHPHYNVIVRDAAEAARAAVVVDRMVQGACERGGTVAAEHGIGKVKLPYAHHRFDELQLRLMRALKSELDPAGILAPGNLFPG